MAWDHWSGCRSFIPGAKSRQMAREEHPAGVARVLTERVHHANGLCLRLHLPTTPRSSERGPQRDPVAVREHHEGAPEKSRAGSALGTQIVE